MRERLKIVRHGAGEVCYLLADTEAAELIRGDISVVLVPVDDWNMQLSPWKAGACFRNGEDFGGGAGKFLQSLAAAIPAFEKENGLSGCRRIVAGYSLAGLFALYAAYETGMFSAAVSASGSMWYDGWIGFISDTAPDAALRYAYFSLGDREKRTRNRRLAAVEECTRAARDILKDRNVCAEFVLEKGGHFDEPSARLARGIDRAAEMLKSK